MGKIKIKPVATLTKHEREQQSKKIAGQEIERIKTLGQDSEKEAAKWVIKEGEEERHKESEKEAEFQWKLHDARDRIFTYRQAILDYLRHLMRNWEDQLPQNTQWFSTKTDKGIVLWIRDTNRNWFAKGMKISGIPKYDLNAMFRLMLGGLNSLDRLSEGNKEKENPGIIIPRK